MLTTILVAPVGRRVGLTTACLGLVRALDRHGLRVAFVKPIANRGLNHSAALMRLGAQLDPPQSVPRAMAEELLSAGDDQTSSRRWPSCCLTQVPCIHDSSATEEESCAGAAGAASTTAVTMASNDAARREWRRM